MSDLYNNTIGQTSRGGQAPPTDLPLATERTSLALDGGGGPAKPGHAEPQS
jgi:hypothetical protein